LVVQRRLVDLLARIGSPHQSRIANVQIIAVHDQTDSRLANYVSLRDVQLRKSLEAAEGIFIAEGEKVIRRAAEAGYRPRSFMLAQRWLANLSDVLEESDAPVYVVSEGLAEQVTGFHIHRGALAAFDRAQRHSLVDLLGARRLLVLEDTVDHSNVGAMIRDAAGLGWDGVLISPRAADPFYRRAIKTSMGAGFYVPRAGMTAWGDDLLHLQDAGFVIVAMALSDQAITLDEFANQISPERKIALLLGTEGDGLSARWQEQADVHVKIPMAGRVDSLNVAAAAAIACYVLAPAVRSS